MSGSSLSQCTYYIVHVHNQLHYIDIFTIQRYVASLLLGTRQYIFSLLFDNQ